MINIKSAEDLKKMRLACKLSSQVLKYAGTQINPGISTFELDKLIYDYIVSHGGKPSFLGLYGFPGSACISINDEIIHGLPDKNRIIRSGDIVTVDVGACVDGFHGDNAYTYRVGKVSESTQKLMRVTKECLSLGIAAAKRGNRVGDIGNAVQTHAENNGYGVIREYVGHGVGRQMHEDPEVPNYGVSGHGARLVPGMTIAIEPMIAEGSYKVNVMPNGWTVKTADGSMAAHYENTVLITKGKAEILTQCSEF